MFEVDLPEEIEKRLENFSAKTNKSKEHYIEEAVRFYLDAYEDTLIMSAEYEEQVRNGTLKTYSLDEIKKRHSLD